MNRSLYDEGNGRTLSSLIGHASIENTRRVTDLANQVSRLSDGQYTLSQVKRALIERGYRNDFLIGEEKEELLEVYNSGSLRVNQIKDMFGISKNRVYTELHRLEAGGAKINWRGRKRFSDEEKALIMNEIENTDKTVVQIARESGRSASSVYSMLRRNGKSVQRFENERRLVTAPSLNRAYLQVTSASNGGVVGLTSISDDYDPYQSQFNDGNLVLSDMPREFTYDSSKEESKISRAARKALTQGLDLGKKGARNLRSGIRKGIEKVTTAFKRDEFDENNDPSLGPNIERRRNFRRHVIGPLAAAAVTLALSGMTYYTYFVREEPLPKYALHQGDYLERVQELAEQRERAPRIDTLNNGSSLIEASTLNSNKMPRLETFPLDSSTSTNIFDLKVGGDFIQNTPQNSPTFLEEHQGNGAGIEVKEDKSVPVALSK